MKIEMGESLFYSWLRHVKECQIVQTNWKVSPQWRLDNGEEVERMMKIVAQHYSQRYGYAIFRQNSSLSQLLRQGECDVLGISSQSTETKYYAVDVAFHEAGLNYGGRQDTVMKVLEKCARTAFCLYGYLDTRDAEIIFASPRITPSVWSDLSARIEDMNKIFMEQGYNFTFKIFANDMFRRSVLEAALQTSENVADTSELFMRGYKMYRMFAEKKSSMVSAGDADVDRYKEWKISQIAQHVLAPMLCGGCATPEEIRAMQTSEYSHEQFGLQFPLLVQEGTDYPRVRYYVDPLSINGEKYYMCSQWYETPANNDRPALLQWIATHKK